MSKSMTNEEAIRILDPDCKEVWKAYDGKDLERCNEACRVAVKALKKQIPKKPIEKDIGKLKIPDTAFCPICDNPVIKDEADNYEQAYCCYCGQALDWSDEE